MKKPFISLTIIIICNLSLFAQKEAYNWDYGSLNVMTFDTPTGEPQILYKSIMPRFYNQTEHTEGCSSISDSNGIFQFSTNGTRIYNYLGIPDSIKDENDYITLGGSFSSTQAALIVKKPGTENIYYIFTTESEEATGKLRYTVIEIDKIEKGIKIISLNNELISNTTEKLIGIKHANGNDVWIITTKRQSNSYYSFLLTEQGITKKPVKSNSSIYWDLSMGQGYMKSDIKGELIANTINNLHNPPLYSGPSNYSIELLKFDKLSGNISSLLGFKIDTSISSLLYGLEFSPDANKLYVCSNILFQLDITILDSNTVNKSFVIIKNVFPGALQLAPNGKIYLERHSSGTSNFAYYTLGVINKPNLSGLTCNYNTNGTSFLSSSSFGLPNFVQGLFDFSIKIIPVSTCEGDELTLTCQITPDITSNQYTWTTPDGKNYNSKTIKISNAKLTDAGLYKLSVDINSTIRTDSAIVDVYSLPKANIKGDLFICKNGTTILSADTEDDYKYKWSTGETTDFITVNKSGKYYLTVENGHGCKAVDSVDIQYKDDLSFKIIGQNEICTGDTIYLKTDLSGTGYKYEWSTGDSSNFIKILKGGFYKVKVISKSGCEGVDSIAITEYEKPDLKFEKSKYTFCKGDSIILSPLTIYSNYKYEWSDGIKSPTRILKESSDLYLIASLGNTCSDTAFINVEVLDIPTSIISTDNIEACYGYNITLKADNYNPEYEYTWSTGEKGEMITISESGKYFLNVSNRNLCISIDSIIITIYPELNPVIKTDKKILCFDDSTIISSTGEYFKYLWSTGDTTSSITIKDEGIYKLIVENDYGCKDTTEIEINKFKADIVSNIDTLNFGQLCIGDTETKNCKFTLTTDYSIIINDIYLKSNLFNLENVNNFKKKYYKGESFEIPITFTPILADEFYDTLIVVSLEPCYYEKKLPIKASSNAIFQFSVPDIAVEVGNYFSIPINSGLKCKNSNTINTDYEVEIILDKEYFAADSVKHGHILDNRIDGNNRIIKIKANSDFNNITDSLSQINLIYGQALSGRKETTPILVNSVTFPNKRYHPELINGSLKISGCLNNLNTIQIFKPTVLSITPNPAEGLVKINIETKEEGILRLNIYNNLGVCIFSKEEFKSNTNNEKFEYYFVQETISSGIFTATLKTRNKLISKQFLIIK